MKNKNDEQKTRRLRSDAFPEEKIDSLFLMTVENILANCTLALGRSSSLI